MPAVPGEIDMADCGGTFGRVSITSVIGQCGAKPHVPPRIYAATSGCFRAFGLNET